MLNKLEIIIQERKRELPEGSYTTILFNKGLNKIAQKVGEEATETIVAALGEDRERQISEISDLMYHLLVLMTELGISLDDINAELELRHPPHQEEA